MKKKKEPWYIHAGLYAVIAILSFVLIKVAIIDPTEYIDTEKMFPEAIEENVAYVVGSAFYAKDGGKNAMRINFSYPSEEQIEEGTQRLGRVIKRQLK